MLASLARVTVSLIVLALVLATLRFTLPDFTELTLMSTVSLAAFEILLRSTPLSAFRVRTLFAALLLSSIF